MPTAADTPADIRTLAEALKSASYGALVTFDDLSQALGRNVLLSQRYLIYAAIKVANEESGAVFASVRKRGYRRLPPDEAHKVGQTARRRVRRAARAAANGITAALRAANAIEPEAQRRANAEISALNLIEHLSMDRNVKPSAAHESTPQSVTETARAALARLGVNAPPLSA